MSVYENYHTKTCPYCNTPHNGLEWKHNKHECDIRVLKNKIDQLKDEKEEALKTLGELNEASTILTGQAEGLLKQLNDMYEIVKAITNCPIPKPPMPPNTTLPYLPY